jgi:hypothetical protein
VPLWMISEIQRLYNKPLVKMDTNVIIKEEQATRTEGCLVPAIVVVFTALFVLCGVCYSVAMFILALINKFA